MLKSDTVGKLAEALAKAQGAMDAAKKDADNPFFKSRYADLAAIVDAIKAPLSSNGLAYVQTTDFDESGSVIVETTLLHLSGEWISGRLSMKPVKADPQGIGSAITYARRYGLQAIVGIPTDDDDGEAASGRPTQQRQRPAAKPSQSTQQPTSPTNGNGQTSQPAPPEQPTEDREVIWNRFIGHIRSQKTDDLSPSDREVNRKAFHNTLKKAGLSTEQMLASLAAIHYELTGEAVPHMTMKATDQMLRGLAKLSAAEVAELKHAADDWLTDMAPALMAQEMGLPMEAKP